MKLLMAVCVRRSRRFSGELDFAVLTWKQQVLMKRSVVAAFAIFVVHYNWHWVLTATISGAISINVNQLLRNLAHRSYCFTKDTFDPISRATTGAEQPWAKREWFCRLHNILYHWTMNIFAQSWCHKMWIGDNVHRLVF